MNPPYKYRAFISYSHGDEKWARWLHRSLETYRLPKHLVGQETEFGPVPARFTPVFRDRDELATATNLGATLTAALEQSACLVVIGSPSAARSRWVNEEILEFKRLGRSDRIFCLIVAGEPGASADPAQAELECFPPALVRVLGAGGELTDERGEPIAADVRPGKDRKATALLKLLAGMLGIGFDELRRREASRRYRRLLAMVSASVAGMVIAIALAAAAWIARNEAVHQKGLAVKEAETARKVTAFIVDLFEVYDPNEGIGSTITAREILDRGAARIETELADQPAIQATLMDTMGTIYTGLGLYRTAIPLMRQSLLKRKSLSGDTAAEIAKTLGHLGEALMLNGDYDEATKRLQEALAIQRKALGKNHADVADTLSALADLMSYTSQYDKGLPLIEEALRIRRKLYGEMHADVAESLGDLGVNFGERGDFKQAEVYLRQALDQQSRLHPGAHPDLAEAMNNLAWALQELGGFTEAEAFYRESLSLKRKLFGDAHPQLAAGLTNLGFVLETRGEYRGAERAYRESLDMNRKLLGESHAEIAAGMNNLAFVLYEKGDRAGAIQMMRESIEMNRRELGPDNPGRGRRGHEPCLLAHVRGRIRRGGEPARRGRRHPEQGAGRGSPPARQYADDPSHSVRRAQAVRGCTRRGQPVAADPGTQAAGRSLADRHGQEREGCRPDGPRALCRSREAPAREPAGPRGLADCRPARAWTRAAGGALCRLGQAGKSGKVRPLGRSDSHNAGPVRRTGFRSMFIRARRPVVRFAGRSERLRGLGTARLDGAPSRITRYEE